MPIAINGSGTITGIVAGGLPDGIIQAADLASGVGGKILQTVQTTKTDTFSTSSSSYVDVTGVSQAITAVSTTSKILIKISIGFVSGSHTGNQAVYPQFQIVRNSTAIALGDASGNRGRCTFSVLTNLHAGYNGTSAAFEFLDSPSSSELSSAITYKIQARNGYYDADQSFYVNRMDNDDNQLYTARTPTTIILQEVAA
jgi:hypothetical protein|tara:strand:+ start:166 stop:762 length:597 start_codon:yes stop_codon:yes gene_type:complete